MHRLNRLNRHRTRRIRHFQKLQAHRRSHCFQRPLLYLRLEKLRRPRWTHLCPIPLRRTDDWRFRRKAANGAVKITTQRLVAPTMWMRPAGVGTMRSWLAHKTQEDRGQQRDGKFAVPSIEDRVHVDLQVQRAATPQPVSGAQSGNDRTRACRSRRLAIRTLTNDTATEIGACIRECFQFVAIDPPR
jgi:hypothetical protein